MVSSQWSRGPFSPGSSGLSQDRKQLLEIALLNYLWPALTILFSLPLLKKRANLWLLPGTVFALAGVFLVMTQGDHVSWSSWREHLQTNPVACILALAAVHPPARSRFCIDSRIGSLMADWERCFGVLPHGHQAHRARGRAPQGSCW